MYQLPQGFLAAGLTCGIKASGRKDLSLFYSERPCTAAGVFTTNCVVGAPVQVSRQRVPATSVRAVIINSGNANACTGQRGLQDAEWMTSLVASQIGSPARDVLVCSTGVIGHLLPRGPLEQGIPTIVQTLQSTPEAFRDAAEAMMTTDTVPKQVSREVLLSQGAVTLAGAAKGAAMISPNMATMLAVIMTDARLTPEQARLWLREGVDSSFNLISVDGHVSTSDTVLLLANGATGVAPVDPSDEVQFRTTLGEVCEDLAQQIIRDAEGAGHFMTVRVSGLRSVEEARRIAREVANSLLVKTAITGNDPNWGRIVSAAGYAGVPFEESDVSLRLNGYLLYDRGLPVPHEAEQVSQSMSTGEVDIDLQFTLGDGSARFWTSDLTQEYVRLNSDYTT